MLSYDMLFLLVESAPDAMLLVDEAGVILFVNTQMEVLFGYTSSEILGKSVECLLPKKLREIHVHHRAHFAEHSRKRSMGENLDPLACKKSGEEFSVEISLSPIKTAQGPLVIAAIRNISEKIKKEKQLVSVKALNTELEHFVYIASHDLQEPLNSLQQLLQMFKEKIQAQLDAESSHLMTRIVNAGVRMSSLIRDLLDFSRLGRKKELTAVDCNVLIQEVQVSLQSLIDSEGVKIIIKNRLPVLRAYVTELRLLFQNLIGNASKFHKKGVSPLITIDVEKTDKGWLFSVADNGIGIEEKFFDRLFVVFQRLHNRDEYEGNGIGLAHCKKIVEMHGGKIWVSSKCGIGTTIYFTLPYETILED